MRKAIGAVVPFLFMHLLCCGALLFFLISGGYLLLLRQEGTNKFFIIPALIVVGGIFWLYKYHGKCCQKKGYKSYGDHIIHYSLYILFSIILGIMFIIYIFIPWWIPNYRGGILLP